MKKLFLVCAFSLFGLMNAQMTSVGGPVTQGTWMFGADFGLAFASSNFETEVDGNTIDGSDTTESTFAITPNASYFVVDNLAVGLGLEYVSSKTENGDELTESTFMVLPNAKYFFGESNVKPYLGLGVGYVSRTYESDADDLTFSGLAVNGKGGVAYFFNTNVAGSLGLDYVYSKTGLDDADDVDVVGNSFLVSVGFSYFL